ncbi:uncharacterized protein LOC132031874 [Lycium ferocissimum]|uniref:uncharacterized protein LOC132031874 n=1 Tax=Lycium ferocissimum TaxID=112874 RepID=UPI002814DC02|nr:uncharacterized protein LOC132031874 [Lycium ferocissimum]
MVNQANITFKYLQGVGANYGSFYKVITGYIEHRFYSQDAEREENMLSLSAWQKNYENAILSANEAERVILRTEGEREKVKEKEEVVKRQIEDLKQVLAHYENEKERLKHDEVKYKEAHEVAKVRMQELGTQLKEAQAKQREIDRGGCSLVYGGPREPPCVVNVNLKTNDWFFCTC